MLISSLISHLNTMKVRDGDIPVTIKFGSQLLNIELVGIEEIEDHECGSYLFNKVFTIEP